MTLLHTNFSASEALLYRRNLLLLAPKTQSQAGVDRLIRARALSPVPRSRRFACSQLVPEALRISLQRNRVVDVKAVDMLL